MGPAEIVASLKELCAEKGPRLQTEDIVDWIERIGGFETNVGVDRLCQEDEGAAVRADARIRRRRLRHADQAAVELPRSTIQGGRYYADILEMPASDRKRLSRQYTRFQSQLRSVRKAMADYFAGQRFFDFYMETGDEDEVAADARCAAARTPARSR